MVDVIGRPKEYDRMKIGRDMINWAATNPEALTVPMFATSIGLHSGILRSWCVTDEDFRAMYIQAKEIMSINRLNAMRSDTLSDSVYMKTLTHFDCDAKAEAREEKTFESSLRKDEDGAKQSTYNIVVPHDLAIGANLPTETISVKHSQSS